MSGPVHRILIEEEAMKPQIVLLITYTSTLPRFTIKDVLNCPFQMRLKADLQQNQLEGSRRTTSALKPRPKPRYENFHA